MIDGRNILVTGGAGFIGSHTCKALRQAGALPVTIDNLSTGHADNVRWGPLIKGDLGDSALVAATLREWDIPAVLHFAASAYVGESVENPGKYYENNVGGMISLLKACCEAKVTAVVLSSSCATYGVPDALPIREDAPQVPINPYGRTKLICEQMLLDHAAASDLRYTTLRYFNAAGADPEGALGERHDPETHLIPSALLAAAGKRNALEIFGTDYPTADGTCERDFIHVTDLARAHVRALERLLGGGDSVVLNLGTGCGHSVREIVAAIARITGRHVPLVERPRRPGDPARLVADPRRAEAILQFRPEMSDIPTILRDAAPWFGLSGFTKDTSDVAAA